MGITNATGILSGSPSGSLPFFIEGEINVDSTPKKLCPEISSNISRIIQCKNIGDNPASVLWSKTSTIQHSLAPGDHYTDISCGHELWGVSELGSKLEISVRQSKAINYSIGDTLMIPVKVRLGIGTGDNYRDINEGSYDSSEAQYLINLQKLKNSDSGVTGWKIFDICSFFPGKSIDFEVVIPSTNNYDLSAPVAIQIFDPLSVGEVLFGIANDVVNLEINNIGQKFVGNLTRNIMQNTVENNKAILSPDFSRHIGRIIAKSQSTGYYDTAIIQSYAPNADIYKGGIFRLTGDF